MLIVELERTADGRIVVRLPNGVTTDNLVAVRQITGFKPSATRPNVYVAVGELRY